VLSSIINSKSKPLKKLTDDLLPAGYGYNKKYRYQINLKTYGVGYNIIQWCLKNCSSKWGWYFIPAKGDEYLEDYENQDAVLTFKSRQDAVYFKLTHA
jgi:hypothetical protein